MRWIYELAAICTGLACVALFVAAADERGGHRARASRRARRAGFLAAGAGLTQLLAAAWLPWSSRNGWALAGGVCAALLCASVALLAGLSKKPRPSCWFAAASWLISVLLDWVASRVR